MRFSLLFITCLFLLVSCSDADERTKKVLPSDLILYATYSEEVVDSVWKCASIASMDLETANVKDLKTAGEKGLNQLVLPLNDYCVGFVEPKNKDKVTMLLSKKKIRKCFPKEMDFLWSDCISPYSNSDKKGYLLYAVKKNGVKPLLTQNDLLDISTETKNNKVIIALLLKSEAAQKFAEFTQVNIGKTIPIAINDIIISAPLVKTVIETGYVEISGDFTREVANEIVERIQPTLH